jgi:hypothetical protein
MADLDIITGIDVTRQVTFKPRGLIRHRHGEELYAAAHVDHPHAQQRSKNAQKENITVPFWEYTLKDIFHEFYQEVAISSQQPPCPQVDTACDLVLSVWDDRSKASRVMCFNEMKRPRDKSTAKLKKLEDQVWGYCQDYLQYYRKEQLIYAATGVGTHIRLWLVRRPRMDLEALWGSNKSADWEQYYDVGDDVRGRKVEEHFFEMLDIFAPGLRASRVSTQYAFGTQSSGSVGPYTAPQGSAQYTVPYTPQFAGAPLIPPQQTAGFTSSTPTDAAEHIDIDQYGDGPYTAPQGSAQYTVAYRPQFVGAPLIAPPQQTAGFTSSTQLLDGAEHVSVDIEAYGNGIDGNSYFVYFTSRPGKVKHAIKDGSVFTSGIGTLNGRDLPCYWYIGTSGRVYWTETLDPNDKGFGIKGKGKGKS